MDGLYAAKDWFTNLLQPVVSFAVKAKLSPDLFTFFGMIGASVAAWGIVVLDPLTTLFGLVVRLAGANLDGAVARARNVQNPLGFFANELGDRISDLAVMLAFVLVAMHTIDVAAMFSTLLATFAAALPTVVSLVGFRLQTKAKIDKPIRINGGPLGKTERCGLAFLAVLAYGVTLPLVSVLLVFSWLVIIGSVATAVFRAKTLSSLLKTQSNQSDRK